MARRTEIILIDDISGENADETVSFGLDGVEYSIDLTAQHAEGLRQSLEKWVNHATRTGGRKKMGTGSAPSGEAHLIREWARKTGRSVSQRGRIPAEIRAAYYAERG